MNTGQRLVQMSGLIARPALEHLRVIQSGLGTIFSSRFSVVASEERTEVTRKAKRTPIAEAPITHRDRSQKPKSQKFAYATTSTMSAVARTEQDAITATSRQASTVATHTFEQATINRKRKTV